MKKCIRKSRWFSISDKKSAQANHETARLIVEKINMQTTGICLRETYLIAGRLSYCHVPFRSIGRIRHPVSGDSILFRFSTLYRLQLFNPQ